MEHSSSGESSYKRILSTRICRKRRNGKYHCYVLLYSSDVKVTTNKVWILTENQVSTYLNDSEYLIAHDLKTNIPVSYWLRNTGKNDKTNTYVATYVYKNGTVLEDDLTDLHGVRPIIYIRY